MDVVAHYSPPSALLSPVHASSYQGRGLLAEADVSRRNSSPAATTSGGSGSQTASQAKTPTSFSTEQMPSRNRSLKVRHLNNDNQEHNNGDQERHQQTPASTTFNRAVEISVMEPLGSMSISPANRDVVLAARKGLFILDLENPYDQPRFLPHLTTWVPADVQWNPHPARANWVASTSNNKLLVWNLDRPASYQVDPSIVMSGGSSLATGSSATSLSNAGGATPLSNLTGTLPHVPGYFEGAGPTVSRSSSISHVLNAHTRAITDINWSPFHPEILASCGIDTWMWAWDLRDPSRPKQGYSAWNAAMTQVKWNRASPHRLATSCDNKVLIWDDRKGALPLATIEAAHSRIYGIDWSRDTSLGLSRLVTCSLDGSVKWWDLDSPAAQQAIGERRLVTEAETTIETHTPVWRARHLPFGNGVMTLPQRGDTSLEMWAKDKPDKPVHRFEGHRDIVKEYLFRTQGGADPNRDDRRFQLITWSKDQTLRLWPISEDMMKSVGHKRDTPIRVLQTRVGATDITYRNPPPPPSPTAAKVDVARSSDVVMKSPPSGSSASNSILPPVEYTRSLLSGSAKASLSGSERASLRMGAGSTGHHSSSSPLTPLIVLDKRQAQGPPGSQISPEQRSFRGVTLTASKGRQPAIGSIASGLEGHASLRSRQSKPIMRSLEQQRREEKRESRLVKQRRQKEEALKLAATKSYMTRGAGSLAHQGRFTIGGNMGKNATGRGAALDAVGWIAGVRMGEEEKDDVPPSLSTTDGRKAAGTDGRTEGNGERGEEDGEEKPDSQRDATQVLGEEIKAVSRSVSGATFERIDVSARSCTVTCYGPWAGRDIACFLRITFHFPRTYPAKAPRFELEHNASVSLKTRAFLLRKVSNILKESALKHPPEPSMEACLCFLRGDFLDDDVLGSSGLDGFWMSGDESEGVDEEEGAKKMELSGLRLPPRRSGASFGPNGLLVTFRPARNEVQVGEVPSPAGQAPTESSSAYGVSTGSGQRGRDETSRFLHSYTALSGAMTSLARQAKEGNAVQELDVVQLMADQNFFAKRIQQQQQQHQHQQRTDSEPASASGNRRRGESKGGSRNIADRLGHIRSSQSRPSSGSRSGRRTRSASPMPGRRTLPSHLIERSQDLINNYSMRNEQDESSHRVHIWNLSRMPALQLPIPTPPPLLRRRSSSLPSSPSALTPRKGGTSSKLSSLAVPDSVPQSMADEQEPRTLMRPSELLRQRRNVVDDPAPQWPPLNASDSGSEEESDEGSDSGSDDYEDSDEEPTANSLLRQSQHDGMSSTVEQIFDTIIWTVPFGFLYLSMDIMIQQQYGRTPTLVGEAGRVASTLPILTAFIYATAIRPNPNRALLQIVLFIISTLSGASFLYIYSRSMMQIVIRRVPPLGTLWMYSLVRLDLSGVLLSLALIWAYAIYHDLPILS